MATSTDSAGQPSAQAWRSLRAVLTVQTQNAFNDNVVRFTLMGIAFVVLQDQKEALDSYKNLIGILISLPFVIFAPIAGWTSDRFSKRTVIQACLYAQIVIIIAIMAAIVVGQLWLATAGFFVLAIQSAFFGPAKLGILKELVGSKKLAVVSGWMQMLAIVAIVFGSPGGGGGYKAARAYVTNDPWLAGLVPIGFILLFAFVALLIVRRIQATPAQHREPLRLGIFFRHFHDLNDVYRSRPVWLAAIGIAFFWFSGAFAIAVFTQIAQEHFSGDTAAAVASYCLASTGVGIAIGSIFVAFISSNRLELGLVPLGALGMAISVGLATIFEPGLHFYLSLCLLGATSAIFLVPQNAHLQDKADPRRRGRVLSASNLINSVAAIVANAAQYGLQSIGLSSTVQLLLLGSASIAVAVYTLWLLPSQFVRILLKILLKLLYRLRIRGEANIPSTGGALMLANHVSWIDGFLIAAACPRDVRFVAYEGFFNNPILGWGMRLFGVVPISSKSARQAIKATAEAVKEGALICIFPEGSLSRTGTMNEFQKGFEIIARQTDGAPVIPVHLDNVWGSIFSFSENRFFRKRPRKVPYTIGVSFGAPIPPKEARVARVREAIATLSREAYDQRPELHTNLALACVDALKKRPTKVCFVDRSEVRRTCFTRGMTLASSLQLAQRWRTSIEEDRVAVALPPSSSSLLTHLGLVLAGKTIVPLPLKASSTLPNALASARIQAVITTKAIREGLPDLPWPSKTVFLNEELRAIDGLPKLQARLAARLTPRRWIKRRLRNLDRTGDREALGLLTDAGEIHFLTHRELLTQLAQIHDVNAFRSGDVLLSVYPNDHLAGQLIGLWLPLLRRYPFVLHTMGSHPASPKALITDENVTVITTDAPGLHFSKEALHQQENAVRMITTFETWRENDSFREVAREHPGITVCHGWIAPNRLHVGALSIPNAESHDVLQEGHRPQAVGKPLPGNHILKEGDESAGPLRGAFPGISADDSLSPLGANGHVDDQDFVHVLPHESS